MARINARFPEVEAAGKPLGMYVSPTVHAHPDMITGSNGLPLTVIPG